MAPRKRDINDATSKGKAIGTAGRRPLHHSTQPHTIENTDFSPQGATVSVQSPQRHGGQLLQMLTTMKEQTKEQQGQSDCEREQAALDR